MLQVLEIIPEVNYQPSSDRWEYVQISSFRGEDEITFLNRMGMQGWECINVKYQGRPVEKMILNDYYKGLFKRKLVAI